MAQLLIGVAGAAIWYARTDQQTNITIDIIDALHYMHPTHFIQQQGRACSSASEKTCSQSNSEKKTRCSS
ncbi:MAG: hypothetical protein WBY71_11485 [Nitrososphaeraceae archaeon]